MTNDEKYKTFLEAYGLINKDLNAYRKYLKDKRLPKAEKDLLAGLLCLVKDKPQEAINLFEGISLSCDFLEGYKQYFQGLAWGMLGHALKSSKCHVKSITLFQTEKKCFHVYRPIAAVSKIYFHMRDAKRLKKYYQVFLDSVDMKSIDHQILDLEYQIFIAFVDENTQFGISLLNKLMVDFKDELEKKMSTYHIYRIMFYVQMENFDQAYMAFEDYKGATGFKIKYNYFFILSFLNFITKNAQIYVYREKFQGPNYYFNQLKLIQNISNENLDEALLIWKKLKKELPSLYKEDFTYVGPKDLFSIALEKAKMNSTISVPKTEANNLINFKKLREIKSALDKLVYVLSNTEQYVSKEDLIKYIWDEEWSPENDNRMRALLTRVKQKRGLKVTSVDGKYKKAS